MNEERSPQKKRRIGAKQLIIIAISVAIACAAILVIGHFISRSFDEFTPQEMADITDEITRTRHFVSDWYAELSQSGKGDCKVYLNELHFEIENYSLAVANGRLRAVYPRGERFFKFEHIRRLEFFEIDGKVRCRVYYGQTGEYTFTV